jgi:hypothetical protein
MGSLWTNGLPYEGPKPIYKFYHKKALHAHGMEGFGCGHTRYVMLYI